MKDFFTLQEIADWQLHNDKSQVELPSIQRGFVWRPKQVEDLWDSILRGYPIGSFLFSKSGDKLYLMDGQQRSTSIFLGYFNPYNQIDSTKAWSIKGELPILWIDIKPDTISNSNKYLFRLTTRSHPWGYQASNNETKLNLFDRRKAIKLFGEHPDNIGGVYTSFKNFTVFPFDCNYPIPLCFFTDSENVENIIANCESFLPEYFSTKRGGFKNKYEFINFLKNNLSVELHNVFSDIERAKKTIIKSNIIDDRVLNEENESENPTLFVRINSAGTTLTGDDLIYSIYKSIFPDLKNLIEYVGFNFISPTQVLSLATRIVSSELGNNNFTKKLNVRDFQRKIKNDDFKNRLKHLILSKEIEKLFEKSISILSCKENLQFNGEIPPVIIKNFIKRNQELYYFFLYWLHTNTNKLDDNIKLKIVSKLLCFAWFGFDNLPRLWSENIANKYFWNEPLNNLMGGAGSYGVHFVLPPDLLNKYYEQEEVINMFRTKNEKKWGLEPDGIGNEIITYYKSVKKEEFELKKSNEFFWKFIGKIQYNKQMILFAQRNYINSIFKDFNQLDEIEDTNAPWDWDHIYPSEWVYRKVYCNQSIKDWNNTNGNFRAISLEHNRSRGNQQSPKDILNEKEREYSFIKENDWAYWKNIDNRIWDNKIDNHFKAITKRTINIYECFWNDLRINDLIDQ